MPFSGILFLLQHYYARHKPLLSWKLIPASTIILPALVLPGVKWIFLVIWWSVAGLDFGKAIYGEPRMASAAIPPPVPPSAGPNVESERRTAEKEIGAQGDQADS